jgi:hypothetical protein
MAGLEKHHKDSDWNYKDWTPPMNWELTDKKRLQCYLLNSDTCP